MNHYINVLEIKTVACTQADQTSEADCQSFKINDQSNRDQVRSSRQEEKGIDRIRFVTTGKLTEWHNNIQIKGIAVQSSE